jgi:hypothetical protein
MRYSIDLREGYLRAELVERETPQETREFSRAVHAVMLEKGGARLLVIVRSSRPIFRVEEYQLSEFLNLVAAIQGLRVALVSDSTELAAAHEYVELIAGQKGIALRAFHAEAPALEWLLGDKG